MSGIFSVKFITKCYCVNENNYILILKKGIHEKHSPGSWDLPGGGVETTDAHTTMNNMFINAIKRELQEECNIIIKSENIQLIHQKLSMHNNVVKIFQFYTIKFDYTPDITLSTEHTEYQRISKEDFLALDFHLSECNYGLHLSNLIA